MPVRRAEETRLLADAMAALEGPGSVGAAVGRFLEVLVPERADVGGVALRDADGRWRTSGVRCAAAVDVAAAQDCVARLAARPVAEAAPRLVRPAHLDPGAAEAWRRAGLRSGLLTPLGAGDAPVGALLLAASDRRLGRGDARFAQTLSRHVALRLAHARLLEQTEDVLRRAARARPAPAALVEARELLRTAPHPIAIVRAEGATDPAYEDANDSFCRLAGAGRDALLGRRADWMIATLDDWAAPQELLRLRLGQLDALDAVTPEATVRLVRLRTVDGVRRYVVHVLDGAVHTPGPEPALLVGARHVHPEAAEAGLAIALDRGHHAVVGIVTGQAGRDAEWARRAADRARDRLQPADLVTWLADGRLMCIVVDHLLQDAQQRFDAFLQGARPTAVGYADTAAGGGAEALLRRAKG